MSLTPRFGGDDVPPSVSARTILIAVIASYDVFIGRRVAPGRLGYAPLVVRR
jgi:hypothetical protein